MRRLERCWALTLLLTLLTARDAVSIGVPSCLNHTLPNVIALVGSDGTNPASDVGAFVVTLRDLANDPVVGARVTVDLSGAPDLAFCSDQLDPSLTVDSPGTMVSAITNSAGQAFFTLLGHGVSEAFSLAQNGRIYVNGQLCGTPTVTAYDLDGANGLGPNDLSAFLSDFASGQPYGRSDYDGSGSLGAHDLALWLTAFGHATQVVSCAGNSP